MSAYNRGDEKVEAYVVRLLAAVVKQAGGELRIDATLIDEVNEATTLIKEYDKAKMQVVLRVGMHSFSEVYRVVGTQGKPREAEPPRTVDPLENLFRAPKAEPAEPASRASTIDNPNLAELEHQRLVRRSAAVIRDELRRRRNTTATE